MITIKSILKIVDITVIIALFFNLDISTINSIITSTKYSTQLSTKNNTYDSINYSIQIRTASINPHSIVTYSFY
jgi:hypothetical protein